MVRQPVILLRRFGNSQRLCRETGRGIRGIATRAPTRWLPDPTTDHRIGQRTHSRRTRTRQRSLGSWRSYGPIGPGPRSPSGSILVGTGSNTLGCMADVGEGWTMEMLEAASEKGCTLHPSAMEPDAAGRIQKSMSDSQAMEVLRKSLGHPLDRAKTVRCKKQEAAADTRHDEPVSRVLLLTRCPPPLDTPGSLFCCYCQTCKYSHGHLGIVRSSLVHGMD
jgi:hypothetical protein